MIFINMESKIIIFYHVHIIYGFDLLINYLKDRKTSKNSK